MNNDSTTSLSIYGQQNFDEEFPVLKAFQQYIDAEQAKGRKRLAIFAVFSVVVILVLVAIFVVLLVDAFHENRRINDRLFEYALSERNRAVAAVTPAAPVVVNPQTDNTAILSLTAKIEELQQKLANNQKEADNAEKARIKEDLQRAENERKAAAAEKKAVEEMKKRIEQEKANKEKAQADEIARLKALLILQKEKAQAEKEKAEKHKKHLEEYRRKYYPDSVDGSKKIEKKAQKTEDEKFEPITYYNENDEEDEVISPSQERQKEYSIPVEKRESSTERKESTIPNWDIP
jgi:phage-related minor tail protein